MEDQPKDVAIIGGGAAGLSAALVLGRARRRVVVVDDGHPRNAPAARMQGYLSRDGMAPGALSAVGRDEVGRYGVELVADRVVDVEAGFTLRLAGGGSVAARQVLLATGAVDALPDVAGASERWGRDLLHCPYCHGWEVRDRPLGVLGSVEHAHLVRRWTDDLVFFPHRTAVTDAQRVGLEADGITVVDGAVARLEVVDDALRAVVLADGRHVSRAALFVRPSLRPHPDGLAGALGCAVDDDGLVAVDASGRTNIPGLWAAGNATDPRAQVITAAGQGSAVAIAINNHLVREDLA